MLSKLAVPFGYVMYLCYRLMKDYGLAIVMFTLLSKIILFPVSVWTHKNSIKLVKLQPQMNRVKAKFFGDPDSIADEQAAIYKKEKYNPFASLVPLFIQIILLMGLINVIYNPLTHILRIDADTADRLVAEEYRISGSEEKASIQLDVISDVQSGRNMQSFSEAAASEVLNEIQNLKLNLGPVSLSDVPVTDGGASLLVPIIAGLSALLLCFVQNRLNPLQAEQGFYGKFATTAVSVGISLFLGGFVPVGIGFYWILSNLFTIIQQVILNKIYDPKKHIDYKELEESKKELEALEGLGKGKNSLASKENAKREKADYKRFFSIANKHLVFYSEKSGFYKYFEGVINYLLEHSNIKIHYITSDPDDKIFELAKSNDRIKPYYIGERKLITLMMKMDADMVIMTMPDLDNFHIKRSYVKKDVEYIFMFHGPLSMHMAMRKGCVDNFDTIFSVGPHTTREVRKIEEVYKLKPKNIVECGYGMLEKLKKEYDAMPKAESDVKTVLIAPSWQNGNIMENSVTGLLDSLLPHKINVIVRPHPQYMRKYAEKLNLLRERYSNYSNLTIEDDFSGNTSIFSADVLISDWSGIAYEYAFVTKKPVLFVNTPMKVMNPEYSKIGIEPLEISLRNKVGTTIEESDVGKAYEAVEKLIDDREKYKNDITKIFDESFYNFGHSSEVAGKYIINQLRAR